MIKKQALQLTTGFITPLVLYTLLIMQTYYMMSVCVCVCLCVCVCVCLCVCVCVFVCVCGVWVCPSGEVYSQSISSHEECQSVESKCMWWDWLVCVCVCVLVDFHLIHSNVLACSM